ncbi:LamB/YcsF family protein [Pseudarthrobacter sp. J1738]|uniref:LamB/YcsF family protein n=1 Tax=unclassified Pseudarthrobacter TaxID=2647000 RepID=UPI003D2A750C
MDLNADLGESFGAWRMGDDAAMFTLVTSANIACGFHAGDPVTMLDSCRGAFDQDVRIGAHVGYRDLAGFGRRDMDVTFDELFGDVLYQLGALDGIAHAVGASVDYVKPHGALYNRIVHDEEQAAAVLAAVQAYDPGLPILGLPNSAILKLGAETIHPIYREAFVDRAYLPDGTLVPRSQDGAVLQDVEAVVRQAVRIAVDGQVVAIDGTTVSVEADSLCVHGDTPGALRMAAAVRDGLEAAGVEIAAFA